LALAKKIAKAIFATLSGAKMAKAIFAGGAKKYQILL
jgi:hypothetical protein